MPLTVGTNSYVTLSEAQTYLFETMRSYEWNSLAPLTSPTDPEKSLQELALVAATRLIDRQALRGLRADSDQALAFPRDYHALTGAPTEVKNAQVEVAYWLAFEYWAKVKMNQPPSGLDLSNFMEGAWDLSSGSGIKLAVKDLTLEEGSEQPKKRLTLAAVESKTLPFPTQLPEAALILLKDHLSLGIALER